MSLTTPSELQFPWTTGRAAYRYGVAVLAVGLAAGARLLLDAYVGPILSPFILFYPAVMLAAWYGGVGPALLTTFLSLILGDFFLFQPPHFFVIKDTSEVLHLVIFVFVSLTISFLTENLRRAAAKQASTAQELLFSQRKIGNILESVQGCFFILDEKGCFVHLNEDCKDYVSCPPDELTGKSVWDAFGDWKDSDFEKKLIQVIGEKEPVEFEFFDSAKSKWYEVRLAPSSKWISVHLFDVTDRKVSEARQVMEHKISQTLAEEGSWEQMFQKILQVIGEGLRWELGAYWDWNPDSDQLFCSKIWSKDEAVYREFLDISLNTQFSSGVGLPGRVWSSGKAFWVRNVVHDSNFPRASVAEKIGLRSGVGFPIRLGGQVVGVIEFFHSQTQEPDENLIQLFESIGSEIGQFIERKRTKEALTIAYEEMEKRVQIRTAQLGKINEALEAEILERKKVEKEVLEISQKEQRRLGAQIHDDLCQDLTGILMMARVLMQKMEHLGMPQAQELRQIGDLLNQAISQAKDMARGLYPVELEADSLMITLRELAGRIQTVYQVDCRFDCPEPIFVEDNNLATHLFRIAQEAVQNSVKHGKAKRIEIRLLRNSEKTVLSVADDGEGMVASYGGGPGIGIHIMKYRARMIDAELEIQENHPQGTILACSFRHSSGDLASEPAEKLSSVYENPSRGKWNKGNGRKRERGV